MQPFGTASKLGAGSASGQDTPMSESRTRQMIRGLFGGSKRTMSSAYPPSSQAPSYPLLDAGPDNTPTLEKRTITHQPSESSSASGAPDKLDLRLFGKKSGYDFFAAELPKLGPDSPVGVGMCGRTFTCETSSWGDVEMALTFTGCDLQGNPKPVNEIGVQLLDAYPDDWQQNRNPPPLEEITQEHLRSITSFVKHNDYSLQFDQSDLTEHVLMLGALNEGTYSMNLTVKPSFYSGLPVPPGVTPRALLAFVTTESLERSIWLGGSRSFPVASTVIDLSDSERGEIVRARNCQGGLVNQSGIQARPEDCPRPQVKSERPPGEHPLSREYCNAARVLVTPAIVFDVPRVSGVYPKGREDVYTIARGYRCPGAGFVRLKKAQPPDIVRLLPTVAIGVVTTDPLAGIPCTPPPQESPF